MTVGSCSAHLSWRTGCGFIIMRVFCHQSSYQSRRVTTFVSSVSPFRLTWVWMITLPVSLQCVSTDSFSSDEFDAHWTTTPWRRWSTPSLRRACTTAMQFLPGRRSPLLTLYSVCWMQQLLSSQTLTSTAATLQSSATADCQWRLSRAVSETLIRADWHFWDFDFGQLLHCFEPNHITWVLASFSRSRLAFSQVSMSTRHPTAASASLAEMLT